MATSRSVRSNSNDVQPLRDALSQLRLRLLDLTGRNRLLNYKHPTGKSLQFVEGDPSALYDRLAEGKTTIVIKGLPEPSRADWTMKNGRWWRPEPKEWANQKSVPTSYDLPEITGAAGDPHLRAPMYVDDLARHCRKIERESVLAIEETGANMLYLVLGFLEFPDQKDSDRIFSAPLLCIPVVMSKKESGGNQIFSLRYTGDDITENLSLREKLRQDHGLILPELNEEEIDILAYFAALKKIIKSRVGFTFRQRVSLCLLSFTNMLLVRDLDPDNWPENKNSNGLLDHPIVKKVFSGSDTAASTMAAAEEHAIEEEPARSIPLVFDADSSQHSALVDILSHRRNVVIEGPPGTGKSQTITNLIAACLASGHRVLFVSEKLAALEVVRNRLSIAGLDPLVLELHSTKANKKQVLDQIARRLEFRIGAPRELSRKLQELETHRKELKGYADLLNTVSNNQFGLTLHEVIWRAENHRQHISKGEGVLTELTVSDAVEITAPELSRRTQALEYLSEQYVLVGGFSTEHPFWGFFPHPMVPGDELRLERTLSCCCELANRLIANTDALCVIVGPCIRLSKDEGTSVRSTVTNFLKVTDEQLPLHLVVGFLEPDGSGRLARRELEKLQGILELFHKLESTVRAGLIYEDRASDEHLSRLRQLQKAGSDVGCELGSIANIKKLSSTVRVEIDQLASAIQMIQGFCEERKISFKSTAEELQQIDALVDVLLDIPEEHLHAQANRLLDPGSVSALENLAFIQSNWCALQTELAEALYLDHLPDDSSLKQAVVTLRQGHAWYRMFQPSWRSAISFHKKLLRQKRRMAASARLADLHRLADFQALKAKWKADSTWDRYLSRSAPEEPFSFDSHLSMARWNRRAMVAMEELGAQVFEPAELTLPAARQLRRQFAEIQKQITAALSAIKSMGQLLPGLTKHKMTGDLLNNARDVVTTFEQCIALIEAEIPSNASLRDAVTACEAALERKRLASVVESNSLVKRLLKDQFLGVNTDADRMLACIAVAEEILRLSVPQEFRRALSSGNAVKCGRQILAALDPILTDLDELDRFSRTMESFGDFGLEAWAGARLSDGLREFAQTLHTRAASAVKHREGAIPWSVYISRRQEVKQLTMARFVDLLEAGHVDPGELASAYAYSVFSSIIRNSFHSYPQLGKFSGLKHSKIREEFKRLDREIIQMRGAEIAAKCTRSAVPPAGNSGARVDDKTEMVLLNHLLPQQRPRMPVRKLLKRAGAAVQSLKPCFLMGPQAVAQYLSPDAVRFDLIVMDEASQLKPEEAIGAIARGSQLVVVGDPKQLPPTSFFTRMSQVGDDEDQFTTTDAESILDVCLSHFRPARKLRWHYRSQHHSLIAFSNNSFYRNLIIFPSPYGHSSRLGVRAIYVADAVYDDQTNYKEALRVVDAVIDYIKNRPSESVGVVTLNLKQRDLIAELLDDKLQNVPGADSYRERWATEAQPLFVKNLENVQGDERDAIIISTTFGKPPGADAVRQNFGPISRQGGWRRLNVLFTRAKRSIALFTSMRPEDIVVDASTPEGTKTLRNYLEYARTGSLTVAQETSTEPESDFEIAVINVLKGHGYEVTPQLSVAGYRIDIAVKHPEFPGTYLAAIECDGAAYHSALSVRDRDRIRQEILESMGWRGRIWRIWSTDWFKMPRQESDKLMDFLDGLRETWKPEYLSGQAWIEVGKKSGVPDANGILFSDMEAVKSTLIDLEDERAIRVGDSVRYFDVNKPDDVLTVQITEDKTDVSAGLVHRGTPLAHTLLGGVVGDEVTMHLPGGPARTFHIIEVKRANV